MNLSFAAIAIATPLVLMGPPRLTVAAGAAGAPLTVTVEHHDGVEEIEMEAKVYRLVDDKVQHVSAKLPKAGATEFTRSFTLAPQRARGESIVLVVRGTHGKDGPFAEAMVRINGAGAVVGIEYPRRKAVVGGFVNPKFSDSDIRSALRQLASP